jgi:hypothetical protein
MLLLSAALATSFDIDHCSVAFQIRRTMSFAPRHCLRRSAIAACASLALLSPSLLPVSAAPSSLHHEVYSIQLQGGQPIALGLSDEGALVAHTLGKRYACTSLMGPKCILTNTDAVAVSVNVLTQLLDQVLAQTVKARAPPSKTATETHLPAATQPPPQPTSHTPSLSPSPDPSNTRHHDDHDDLTEQELVAAAEVKQMLADRFGAVQFADGLGLLQEDDILEAYTLDEHGNEVVMDPAMLKEYISSGAFDDHVDPETGVIHEVVEYVDDEDWTDEERQRERRRERQARGDRP